MKFRNHLGIASWAAAAMIAASVLFAAPATANVITLTVTGTVTQANNTDGAGLFGPAGGLLDGLPGTVSFTYDTGVGDYFQLPGIIGLQQGSIYGQLISMTGLVTVNGISQPIIATSLGEVYHEPGIGLFQADLADLPAGYNAFLTLFIWNLSPFPADITSSYFAAGSDPSDLVNYTYSDSNTFSTTNINFQRETFSITSAASIPEPLTLSLFGTGLVGALAMRACKKKDKAR
jgi:hypothetical protein